MWQLEEWQQSYYRRTGELLKEVRGIDAEDFSTKHQIWWFFNIFLEAVITFENHWEAPTICFIWKVGHILESPESCCKLSSLCTSGCTSLRRQRRQCLLLCFYLSNQTWVPFIGKCQPGTICWRGFQEIYFLPLECSGDSTKLTIDNLV